MNLKFVSAPSPTTTTPPSSVSALIVNDPELSVVAKPTFGKITDEPATAAYAMSKSVGAAKSPHASLPSGSTANGSMIGAGYPAQRPRWCTRPNSECCADHMQCISGLLLWEIASRRRLQRDWEHPQEAPVPRAPVIYHTPGDAPYTGSELSTARSTVEVSARPSPDAAYACPSNVTPAHLLGA